MPSSQVFKCPYCEQQITAQHEPNFTIVDVGKAHVAVLSCPACQKALGTILNSPPPQSRGSG